MENKIDSALFLVSSPFQCICMLEAINYFKIEDYKVLVTYFDNCNLDKIDILLKNNNISYTKKKVAHLFFGVMPFLFSMHKHYKNIFIGYLYSTTGNAIANILASFKANIYILDDGVQALSFFSSSPRKINYKLLKRLVVSFYKLIGIVKLVEKPAFFTIFDVSSSKYKVIKNPLALLKSKLKESRETNGIYIIGTNSSMLDFKYYSYEQYLNALYKYISHKFPDEIVYYCPHRADKNLKEIYVICNKLHVKIFDTKVSVEYDFIEKKINPVLVVGFTSNALYTLHIIFPNIPINTVMYNLNSDEYDKEIQIIRNRMSESGISTIKVL